MKILFTRFPLESALGGAEWQVLSLMEGLKQRGHEVFFMGSCPTLLRLCKERNITHEKVEIGPPPVSKKTILRFFFERKKMKKRLMDHLGQKNMDVIVMLSLSEKILLSSNDLPSRPKMFWIEHDKVGKWLTKNPWLSELKKRSKNAMTIVVSNLSKRLYEGLKWPGDIVVIPNGIDPKRLEGSSEKAVPPLIGCIARLSPEKGIDVLIDAMTDLPEANCTIVGKGREEGYLRKIIAERALSDRVTIIPTVDDLGAFYRSLTAFVLPSVEHDPFGLVAAEAMLCSVPTVVTDQCGVADFLQKEKDVLIVSAGSSHEMRKAIKVIISDSERALHLAEKGRNTAEETFALEKMINAYNQEFLRNETA